MRKPEFTRLNPKVIGNMWALRELRMFENKTKEEKLSSTALIVLPLPVVAQDLSEKCISFSRTLSNAFIVCVGLRLQEKKHNRNKIIEPKIYLRRWWSSCRTIGYRTEIVATRAKVFFWLDLNAHHSFVCNPEFLVEIVCSPNRQQ